MIRVLVVDDEERIRQIISTYLVNEGFSVGEASDGEEALRKFHGENWHFVVLDIMMPKLDGIKICQEIRKTSKVPILMLTAKNEEIDRVLGLELGADDYLGKPFSPRELVARIKAVLRRTEKDPMSANALIFNNLKLDLRGRRVEVNGQDISLTSKEFDLLALLAQNAGRPFKREELLVGCWGYDYYGDLRTVDTHINRLRDKLKTAGAPPLISTVWGVGYKFEG